MTRPVEQLLQEARALSADFDRLSEAVGDRVGLNQSDLLAMDHISRSRGLTAGQLAERLGLTTGAITGVIDRLERAGYARRVADATDRRRVMVVRTPKEARIGDLYAPLATALRRSAQRYSDRDLALINGFIRELRGILQHGVGELGGERRPRKA